MTSRARRAPASSSPASPSGNPLGPTGGSGPPRSNSLSGDGEALAEAIFDGLAAGTFLYIATFGILKREFSEPSRLVPKFAAALAGVVLIAIVSVWA